jgi:hypothetical protein
MSALPAPPTVRRLTREDVVRLGQAGRPWEFVPVALQALASAPQDAGLRVLCAANLAQLGLKTAALEQLRAVEGAAAVDPAVAGLQRAALALRRRGGKGTHRSSIGPTAARR